MGPLLGTSVFVISLFYGISSFSASYFETACVLTNLEAFSLHQGRIIMIQKTFLGLGSSFISQIYIAFFQGYPISNFFLFIGIFTTLIGVYGAHVTRLPTPSTRVDGLNRKGFTTRDIIEPTLGEKEKPLVEGDSHALDTTFDATFRYGIGTTIFVVIFIALVSILEEYVYFSPTGRVLSGAVTIFLVFAFAGMVVLAPKLNHTNDVAKDSAAVNATPAPPPMDLHEPLNDVVDDHTNMYTGRVDRNGAVWFLNESPLSVNLRTLNLALMWVVSFGVWGTTTLISSNSSQIYQALDFDDYKSTTNVVYVSIFGVASASGRLFVGGIQPWLLSERRHVVTLFPIAPIINIVALPLFFLLPPKALILPFFLTGLATGCTWGSTVLIIKSLFHPKNTGVHYNVLYTAGMLAPLVMNLGLFGPIFDRQSKIQGHYKDHSCNGTVCVMIPLMVSLGLNVIAFIAAYAFYRRITAKGGF